MDTPHNPSSHDPNAPQYPRYPRYDDRYYDEKYGRRKKSRWWIPLLVFLIIIFGFFALLVGGIIAITGAMEKKSAVVKNHSVLHLRVSGGIQERSQEDFFSFLDDRDRPPALFDVLQGIRKAKFDENIDGIFIEGGLRAGGAKLAEIRAALEDFKQSGKFIYAYIDIGSERDYYIASVADSVFMPTEGVMEMNGFSIVSPFYKGTLDKIGVNFHIEQFEEYKSFAESYSRTSFSEPAKQELRELLNARFDDFVRVVSASRNMSPEAVRSVLLRGVYTADSLVALGFVDNIRSKGAMREQILARVNHGESAQGGADQASNGEASKQGDSATTQTEQRKKSVAEKVREKVAAKVAAKQAESDAENTTTENEEENDDTNDGGDKKLPHKPLKNIRLVNIARYVNSDSFSNADDGKPTASDKAIALISASGTIVSSGDEDDQLVASAFVRELKKARESKKIKAIILRIDSPGGSAFASDEMWEEIRKTSKIKPVYASLSDVAASGGYYMAMACDTIIAHPNTITGSIGVILMLPDVSAMLDKIGVSMDTVATSSSAIGYDPSLPLNASDKARIHLESEKVYRRFVARVAESRKRPYEEIRGVAKGRVWMGQRASEVGLVDTLGGLQMAIAIAKRRLGVDEGTKVEIRRYPSDETNRVERLVKKYFADDEDDNAETNAETETSFNILNAVQKRVDTKMLEKNALWRVLPESVRAHISYLLELSTIAEKERTLLALPYVPKIE
ncbi:MAG: signal peptide peptidase SppA [Candidatus Kapaibacterium sp.]|nr:MAG: signal peptide peptidase SppA [Candidatus Kapabacteria bacterium]